MPFAQNTVHLARREMLVEPEYGYGWRCHWDFPSRSNVKPIPIEVELPKPFRCVAADVLFDSGAAYALTARCELGVTGRAFSWVCFIPHTDTTMDLTANGVVCSLLLSSTVPRLAQILPPPLPKWHHADSRPHVRGWGKLTLLA